MKLNQITDFNVSKDIENYEISPEKIEEKLHFPQQSSEELARKISKAVESGKNVIFTGPPGTGKTELAETAAEEFQSQTRGGEKTEPKIVTATADWSTFDTIGGYMPEKGNGELSFNPGLILKCFKDQETREQLNQTLVIDEINRSNIDEAFGELFTALTGQKVELPYQEEEGQVRVEPGDKSDKRVTSSTYIIPESWRMFATMNTYDKTSLYDMSYAFMRRFAFIQVNSPTIPEKGQSEFIQEYFDVWNSSNNEISLSDSQKELIANIWSTIQNPGLENAEGREIGPALIKDLSTYTSKNLDNGENKFELYLAEGITSFLLPQLEGTMSGEEIIEQVKQQFEGRDNEEKAQEILEKAKDEII
jgi:MoxR-like ATPase